MARKFEGDGESVVWRCDDVLVIGFDTGWSGLRELADDSDLVE